MNANDRPMPRLARAEPDGPLRLAVDWAEGRRAGRSETLDLLPLVGTHKFYRPLRKSAALFATA
ncbi:MAG TPA: hypothetical protein VM434_01895, partial [Beijerinckiaceae bacterium]|nr:hypothetical protein [Beijerinckiaceae bacterium]